MRRFFKKNKKPLLISVAAVLFCLIAVVAGAYADYLLRQRAETPTDGGIKETVDQLQISVTVFDHPVPLVNTAVKAHLAASVEVDVHDVFKTYQGKEFRLDQGLPVTLSYELLGVPAGYTVENAVFSVTEQASPTDVLRYVPEKGKTSVNCYNLKSATAYAYTLDVTFTNGVKTAVSGAFNTEHSPRMLTVEGGYNMRDFGGWSTADGYTLRQGLLYRGCEIDGAVESKYTLTDAGRRVMLEQLRIRTDMDLRTPEESWSKDSALGDGVKHVYYSAPMYAAIFNNAQNAEVMRKVFADLADARHYPIYLHCTYGQDRTGTVCYLLGGLLGMDKKDLIKEYELSALHHGYVATRDMDAFMARVDQCAGNTLGEKVEGYLLSIGVSPAQIQSIRDIFLEKQQNTQA